jgi:sugar/nucleoside kinase (ribokinase family)
MLTRAAADAVGLPRNPGHHPSPLEGVELCVLPSRVSTTFSNIYNATGHRIQIVETVAPAIAPSELPAPWASVPLALLGPIAGELPESWATAFPNACVAVAAQGWLRRWDETGRVFPTRWPDPEPFLRNADVVILSQEDVRGDTAYINELAALARLMVITDGRHGASVYQNGDVWHIAARPAKEVDLTGAGDVFAAAFLIRFAETGDAKTAARFANVVASLSVEGVGMTAIPTRARADREL